MAFQRANSIGLLCKLYMQRAEVAQCWSESYMLPINVNYKVEKGQYFMKTKHSEWLFIITLLNLAGGELLMHIHCVTCLKYKGSAMHLEVSYFSG